MTDRLTITRDILQQLKNCTVAAFYLTEKDKTCKMALELTVSQHGLDAKTTVEHFTSCSFTIYHGKQDNVDRDYFYKAIFSEPYCNQSGTWSALRKLLKVGDQLTFAVVGKNNSPSVEEKGLTVSELRATVWRDGKTVVYDMLFLYTVETVNYCFLSVQRDCKKS